MIPNIIADFSDDLDTCTITIDGHVYRDLRVKKVNLRDWQEPEMTYSVKIPCAKVLGQDYMLCAGRDYIYSYTHRERKPLVLTIAEDDDEIVDLPKRKKKKVDIKQERLL